MIKAYLLTTGADGHSHVQSGYLADGVFTDGGSIRFQETAPHTFFTWHTAPANQYVICLAGTLRFNTFTGEEFTLHPGEVLIAMDTTGTGHTWQMLGDEPWKRAYVLFDPSKTINFTPDNI
ncbi:MAG: cupin domain-containing protein [Bacteroidota bacterium]